MSTFDTLFFQRLLSSAGLYTGKLDGRWGPKTQGAQDQFDKLFAMAAQNIGAFDPRTEGNIHTLLPVAQEACRRFLNSAKSTHSEFVVKVLSGTRTYAEQNGLFNQRPQVTKARGGQSNHNFGIAWDIGIFVNGEYYDGADRSPVRAQAEEQAYIDLRNSTKAAFPNIEWGGDWHSIVDRPHYQLATGKTVDQIRVLFEAGKPYV